MKLSKGDRQSLQAVLYWQADGNPPQRVQMGRGADGTYTANVEARGSRMSVWMEAGDDKTAPAAIKVVPRLAVSVVGAARDRAEIRLASRNPAFRKAAATGRSVSETRGADHGRAGLRRAAFS